MPSKQTIKYASVASGTSSSSAATSNSNNNNNIIDQKPTGQYQKQANGATAVASMSLSSAYHNHFKNQQLDNYSRTIMSPHTFHMESSLASSHKSTKTNKSQPPMFAYLNNELSSCHSKIDSHNHHQHQHQHHQPNTYSANQMMMMNGGRVNYTNNTNQSSSSKYNIDENFNHIMNGTTDRIVRRGDFCGPIYDVDHLATFTVGSRYGLLKAEDGMRKLRIMEKTQGIWTMDCQLMIDENYIVAFDKKTGQEVELFPLDLVHDPTSVISDDKKDIYNNILLFTVLEDPRKKLSSSNTPSEMHIFQCVRAHSAEIVDEIYRVKEGRRFTANPMQQHQQFVSPMPSRYPNDDGFDAYRKYSAMMPPNEARHLNINSNQSSGVSPMPQQAQSRASHSATYHNNDLLSQTAKIEMDVKALNLCFDDIERFVTRLQNACEYYKELERRQKQRKSPKKQIGDGMLSMRAQMPPPQHFSDIFQKFKYSFNLLAKLKAHIHDPNAPELVHFLFTPLALIVNSTKDQAYRGISKTVWQPLLTKEAKELLLNCLTSKEQDLWQSLGEAWTVCKEEVAKQPHLFAHLESQTYVPTFYNGWTMPPIQPSSSSSSSSSTSTSAASSAAAVAHQHAHDHVDARQHVQPNNQMNSAMSSKNGRHVVGDEHGSAAVAKQSAATKSTPASAMRQNPTAAISTNTNTGNNNNNSEKGSRVSEEMRKWALDLGYRGVKVYEVIHDRQANNDKELTIKTGELLEVLDDKRNWWRLRNFHGQIGHAPVTILKPWEMTAGNQHADEKVGVYY